MLDKRLAELIADQVIGELERRKGFRNVLDDMDDADRYEFKETLARLIEGH